MIYRTKNIFLSLLLACTVLEAGKGQILVAKSKRNNCACVEKAIKVAKGKDILRSTTVGLYAFNSTRKKIKIISSVNADLSVVPAFTLKIITTAAALEV